MEFVIDLNVEINASPEVVWEVISDMDAYPEWNPFVVECESTLKEGDPIKMRVQIFDSFAQPQTETITKHVPGTELCYSVDGGKINAVSSNRCHRLTPLDDGRTHYQSYFRLEGWAVGFVKFLLGGKLRKGFTGMTDGIAKRAEELAAKQ